MKPKDPYIQIEEEITMFIDSHHDRVRATYAMNHMLKTATIIGGKLQQDIEKLELDFRDYLAGPMDVARHKKIMEDALRIKNEAREI